MCTHPFAKKALTLHLARSEGHERYFGCNLMHRKVLASSHQHLIAEAPSHANPEFRTALISNLSHEPSQWPFYFFDPRFRDTHPGGLWWVEKTKELAEVIPLPILAQRLAVVEWFPYKSTKHKHGCRVRSQAYGFSLVASAMERGALVVIARSVRFWEGSVPALQYYPRKLTLSSKENVVLTRNNVLLNDKKKPAAWDLLVNALL